MIATRNLNSDEPITESSVSPGLSIVMVSWNTCEAVLDAIGAVERAGSDLPFQIELILVDNASRDETLESVRERFPWVRVIANRRNAGFARANNQAFPHCHAPCVLLLNPDTLASADALAGLVEFLHDNSDAGVAGIQLLHEDGRLQNSYDSFPALETELLSKHLLRVLFPSSYPSKRHIPVEPIAVDIVIGACLAIRTDLLRELGGFDERYFLFMEEADLCYRVWQAGRKVYHLPALKIYHVHHFSKEQFPAHATIEYFRSTYLYFWKNRPWIVAASFRVLKTLKLCCVSLLLSVIAVILTVGRVPRHRRRLGVRARLAFWHLLGCPESWGMRQVSGFRGYDRRDETRGFRSWTCILESGSSPEIASLFGTPGEIERRLEREGELVKRSRSKRSYRIEVAGRRILVTLHRAGALEGFLQVPVGLWAFERAIEISDLGVRTISPLAAGSSRALAMGGLSWIAFEEHGDLVKLQHAIAVDQGMPRDQRFRERIRAYGAFVRRLHDTGVTQYDLNPGNALIEPDHATTVDDILLIDTERVRVGNSLSWSARADALARLNRLLAGITRADRLRFLDSYVTSVADSMPGETSRDEGEASRSRALARAVLERMPRVRAGEGRRAMRNCMRENWFFGRIDEGHFRRRAYPWQEKPFLDEASAEKLADRLLGDVALPEFFELREARGRGEAAWRDANRAFQSGECGDLPVLFVRRRGVERILLSHKTKIDNELESLL